MKSKEYIIEFTKLRKGVNDFTYVIDDKFLSGIEGQHPKHANVQVQMQLLKTENMYNLSFEFDGVVKLICDVCLDDFDLPLKAKFHLIMKISEVENYSNDEIIYITPTLIDYDLTQFLYESFILSLPIKMVCSMGNKACNADVLEKLEEMKSTGTQIENNTIDPRWEDLKGIFNN